MPARAMLRVRECILILLVLGPALILGEEDFGQSRRSRGIFSNFGSFFAGGRHCGDPDACPPHHCRLDDAVVHGFCCGCARSSDRVPIKCPPWLQCPLSPFPLCDDYNYMMDCCC